MSSFYIGYLPKAPDDLAKFLRRVLALLIPGAILVATLLIVAQQRFSPAFFEWQRVRDFAGVIEEHPYPTLLVQRPGANAGFSRYLLVGIGKSGASKEVAGFDRRQVSLRGKLIFRSGGTLIEVMPASVHATGGSINPEPFLPGEIVRVQGEIVDSKCYGGVMNPGSGKVHRDCAVRCLSGGVPPVLLTQNANGEAILYELFQRDGTSLPKEKFLDRVAEPIWVRGRLLRVGSTNAIEVAQIE